jgi:hypothetical protein
MVIKKEKVLLIIKIMMFMKDNLKEIKKMVLGLWNILMVKYMKDIGKKIKNMVKEHFIFKKKIKLSDFGKKINFKNKMQQILFEK